MTLKELGNCSGGIDYSAVAVSILRLVRKSGKDRALRKLMKYVAEQCQKVKMRPRSIVGFSIDEWRWVSRIE
jgi:hypothetical protein